MSPTVITLIITGSGLVLSILAQIWIRANAQGADKRTLLNLEGSMSKLLTFNEERLSFQARITEFVGTQKDWNVKIEGQYNKLMEGQAQMRGENIVRDREYRER